MISVIIPAYNAEKTLERSVSSVFRGENCDVECIVVNDGSHDLTEYILSDLKKRFTKLNVVNIPNSGVSQARNIGIKNACGEWLLFLDADDELVENWQGIVLKQLCQSNADVILFEYINVIPGNQDFITHYSIGDSYSDKDVNRLLLATPELNTCWGKLIKREIVQQNNIFFPADIKYGEDAIFIQNVCLKAKRKIICKQAILRYYYNYNGAMRADAIDKRLQDGIQLLDNRLHYAAAKQVPELVDDIYIHHFRSITAMMVDISKYCEKKRDSYKVLHLHRYTQNIMERVNLKKLSKIKRFEFLLMKKAFPLSITYFTVKGLFRKENTF